MTILDRHVLKSFAKAWVVCFVSLVSLYLVIDAFNHFDDLLEASRLLRKTLPETMAMYYGYQLVLIFDRLCGIILLLAAAFTVAWMQRQNELTPLLSAGVPMRRVLRPIYVGSVIFLLVQTVNREFVIPNIAEELEHSAGDPTGQRERFVTGGFDTSGVLLEGRKAVPREKVVTRFTCTIPTRVGGTMLHVIAKEAKFLPAGTPLPDSSVRRESGWLMTSSEPAELPKDIAGDLLVPISEGQFFVKVENLDFRRMTRNKTWYQYASLMDLIDEMETTGASHLAHLATQLHIRVASPVVTLLAITLGLGIVLRESAKNVFLNTGLCLTVAAAVFVVVIAGKYLGEREYLAAAFAGWLPILVFGPLAFVLRDSIQT
jgi:lipopolysaccharide export system permease protein